VAVTHIRGLLDTSQVVSGKVLQYSAVPDVALLQLKAVWTSVTSPITTLHVPVHGAAEVHEVATYRSQLAGQLRAVGDKDLKQALPAKATETDKNSNPVATPIVLRLNWCHPPSADCYLEARNLQGGFWCGEKRFSKRLKY
jgi:hypothetical protein